MKVGQEEKALVSQGQGVDMTWVHQELDTASQPWLTDENTGAQCSLNN